MAGKAGAALHREPGGLFSTMTSASSCRIAASSASRSPALRNDAGAPAADRSPQRRHANLLSGREPRRGFDAPAVDAHLPGADELLQMAEAEARIMQLEPAVEPDAGLVGVDLFVSTAFTRPPA